jgi:hypothetical protein
MFDEIGIEVLDGDYIIKVQKILILLIFWV